MNDEEREQFLEWAKHAVAGLRDSAIMLALWDDDDQPSRMEFALQIGHCVLTDKPILVIAPHGTRIPEKLRAVATAVVISDRNNFADAEPLIAAALKGFVVQ